eukprot:500944_1
MQQAHNDIEQIKSKYEALEYKYNIMEMENKEHKTHIANLEQQIIDLIEEYNEEKIHEEHLLQLILHDNINHEPLKFDISTMSHSTTNYDDEIQILKTELKTATTSMQSLLSENTELKNQNEKFRNAMEMNNKQKQIFTDTIMQKDKHINTLQQEIRALQDAEYSEMDVNIDGANKMTTPWMMNNSIESVHRIYFTPTIDVSSDMYNVDNVQYVQNSYDAKLTEFTEYSVVPEVEELKIKVQKLETENMKLMEMVFDTPVSDEKCDEAYSFIDDSEWSNDEQVTSEFNDKDMHEMEELFGKCISVVDQADLYKKAKTNLLWYSMFR